MLFVTALRYPFTTVPDGELSPVTQARNPPPISAPTCESGRDEESDELGPIVEIRGPDGVCGGAAATD